MNTLRQRHERLRPAFKYAEDAAGGKIVCCELNKLAAERFLRDLDTGDKRGLEFDEVKALHALCFFDYLKHSKGEWAGKPFELSAWQAFIVINLFGWIKKKDSFRRFLRAYNEIARKNGKSTLSAGVGLYLFFGDGEPGSEIYSAATKRDQARIVHGEAVRMVKASPELAKRITIFRDNLHVVNTASKFEPLGADENTMDGLNVHGAIIDELHAHKNRGVYDVLDTATGARRQPLIFTITTAGFDRHSICYELRDYSEKILRGIIEDDSFFAFIACADKDDDPWDETTWVKANPNLGVSVRLDDLRGKADKAKQIPGYQNTFKRLHLNIWTTQDERWLDVATWDACAGEIDLEKLKGKPCWAGLDLSSTMDISAFSLVFDLDNRLIVLPYFWIPLENARQRALRDRVPYLTWIEQGLVFATEGNVIDYDFIRAHINEMAEIYDIKEIAIDRWNATQITTQFQGDGLTVVPFGQGFASMTSPCKELEKLLLSKKLLHSGNAVLRWMASNVAVKQDAAGNIKPAKDKSTERIDGIVALIMAIGAKSLSKSEEFVYNSTGMYTG